MTFKDDLHKFVDSHIREIQYLAYGIGAVGVILVVRDLRLATTFRHVSEIPPKFIASHVTLQGCVQGVSSQGQLHIRHQPVFSLPFSNWVYRLRSGQLQNGGLTVEIAGVKMTPEAVSWMSESLPDQHVWYTLYHRTEDSLLCSVYKKKNWLFKLHINEDLVKRGLASVSDGELHSILPGPLISSLCAAESRAQKAKVGVWRKEVYRDETDGTSVFRRVWQWLKGKLKWKKSV